MIQTQQQLTHFLNTIETQTHLAIDTEFKRIDTFYPILCLVQIATENAVECIDILAIEDLEPLFKKLYQTDSVWIVHSARQDIEALYYLSKRLPTQLFDTQIAAHFLNHPAQISYQNLTEILQGVILDKAYTRLDWTTRPLPEAALEYALDDVRYLIKNYAQLNEQLTTEDKLDWLMQDGLDLSDIRLYLPNLEQAWKKIKGLSRLPKSTHQKAAQLAAWRESQAIDRNKPRKWIMSDEQLLDYSLKKTKLSDANQSLFKDFLSQQIQLTQTRIQVEAHQAPSKSEKQQKNELQKLIKKIAVQYNLDETIIANGKTLMKFIRGDQSVSFLTGWRYHILKEELENAKQS
ncbi:ribonuclease D [Candidatus Thioglobus autotrophicus]|uniref:Ribonuclease D n=1 Tax=Candidatus Thioglobus autotrophicus TaxID=1705394 RepID=A0A0M4NSW5_9GAMM|nr:HRDC domain-containing protein [Candidatus Thioglobus autotrophicus]ALE51982.1 ribonuclease D [Candidatus Thioglobus autotrophicus]